MKKFSIFAAALTILGMPRALALALVLIFGVMVGAFVQNSSLVSEEDMIFLYVENSFEVENWL